MRRTQIYEFIRKVKAGKMAADCRNRNPKKKIRTAVFIAHLAVAVEKDRQVMIRKLTLVHGVLLCTTKCSTQGSEPGKEIERRVPNIRLKTATVVMD